MPPSVQLDHLAFSWPDGRTVLDDVSLVLGPGRTGLVGDNGAGKSTLLRLLSGELAPTSGTVSVRGHVTRLRQDLTLDTRRRVDDVLGIRAVRAALAALDAGTGTAQDLAVVGDDWDVEDRALALLGRVGLGRAVLDRAIGALSGGESALVGLTGALLGRPDVLLLDEPTNDLDRAGRAGVRALIEEFPGVLVVVSHDRELLAGVDRVVEVRAGAVRSFGGNLTAFEQALAQEQDVARRRVRDARGDLRRQEDELRRARTVIDRRRRYGARIQAERRQPKILMGARKRAAEVSAGRHRNLHEDRVDTARGRLVEAERAVRDDEPVRIDLPDTEVPAGRRVLVADGLVPRGGPPVDVELRGPERVALTGPNGAGKTTLVRCLLGREPAARGTARVAVPWGYLPQRLDVLEDGLGVLANLRRAAPGATENRLRAGLARLGLRGPQVSRPVGSLSGGERFRAVLAVLLLADPAPQLLVLDEPTNSLDRASTDRLVQALGAYRGALVVISHDDDFLARIAPTRWWTLDGHLTDAADPPGGARSTWGDRRRDA